MATRSVRQEMHDCCEHLISRAKGLWKRLPKSTIYKGIILLGAIVTIIVGLRACIMPSDKPLAPEHARLIEKLIEKIPTEVNQRQPPPITHEQQKSLERLSATWKDIGGRSRDSHRSYSLKWA